MVLGTESKYESHVEKKNKEALFSLGLILYPSLWCFWRSSQSPSSNRSWSTIRGSVHLECPIFSPFTGPQYLPKDLSNPEEVMQSDLWQLKLVNTSYKIQLLWDLKLKYLYNINWVKENETDLGLWKQKAVDRKTRISRLNTMQRKECSSVEKYCHLLGSRTCLC